MISIVVTILLAGVCSGALFATLKVLRSQASKEVGKERDVFKAEIAKFDDAIEVALSSLSGMSPLSDVRELEEKRKKIAADFDVERGKVTKLEGDLAALQKKVDKQEARHNELKKGKEDADRIADDIRANQEKLLAESKKLESELGQSKAQMSALVSSLPLDADQRAAIKEITDAVEKLGEQLKTLMEVNEVTSGRFLALQTQYSELEKEYRKLVDKELSGEG